MTGMARNNAAKTRGKPFSAGNPGRPRGARNKATLLAETLLDGEADAITRKAIEMAKAGEGVALRLCLERLLPPRRDRAVNFQLPEIKGPADAANAAGAILGAVATGELSPIEGSEVSKVIESYVRALEASDLAARLTALETQLGRNGL